MRTKRYGNHDFLEDDKGYVHVYTDGSCENNGRNNAIAGYGVYFGEDHALYVPFKIIFIFTLFYDFIFVVNYLEFHVFFHL